MRRVVHRFVIALIAAVVVLFAARASFAATKDECLEAHGRGQVERDKGQVVRARHTFTACAQSTCPTLVQSDCSRMSEELSHLIPTVTFVARDSNGADMPTTSVLVDDVLVATRLDDGKAYELDPGKHAIRYAHESDETTLRVVLNQGEKGRVLTATFPSPTLPLASSPPPAPAARVAAPRAALSLDAPEPKRAMLPLGVAGIGAAAVATGAIIALVELARVPSRCELSSYECAAAPGDPMFAEAKSSVSRANTGVAIGVVGAAVLVSGVVWYLLSPARLDAPRRGQIASPYVVSF